MDPYEGEIASLWRQKDEAEEYDRQERREAREERDRRVGPMQNKLAIATQQQAVSVMPTQGEWSLMRDMAEQLLPTGFLPNHIKRPEQAVAIMLKGRELQIPPMQALSSITVINGKPTASAELMLALVHRDHGTGAMWVEESTNQACTVGYRAGRREKFYSFTIEDAARAGLNSQVWKNYPAAMLRARAISAVARMAFPGSIAGIYSPGELGDEVEVDEDGIVLTASVEPQVAPQRAERQNTTPDTQHRQTPPQRPAQRATATVEPEADVLDQIPEDLKEVIATELWKKDSWADMSEDGLENVRVFMHKKGSKTRQEKFDQVVRDWEAAQHDDDDVIEGEIVQNELMPDEDTVPTKPASAYT